MHNNNLLGKNIQRLRIIHGDTLESLGEAIGFAKSTIKGYENGSRKPDPDTLKAIAYYYGKTIDELMYTDLTGLEVIDIQQISLPSAIEAFKKVMPIFSSDKAMHNASFKKGYDLCLELLTGFENGKILRGTIITDIAELFLQAISETDAPEAVANLVWCIFVWWTQIFDTKQMLELQNKLLTRKIDLLELTKEMKKNTLEVTTQKQSFISDFDELLNELIKNLKSDKGWSNLGDYYLALRYTYGLVDTGLSEEMNVAIGIQLMCAYVQLDNKYAKTFLLI